MASKEHPSLKGWSRYFVSAEDGRVICPILSADTLSPQSAIELARQLLEAASAAEGQRLMIEDVVRRGLPALHLQSSPSRQ